MDDVNSMDDGYGICGCGAPLSPVWFREEEYEQVGGMRIKTGRHRNAVSHLLCECCGAQVVVDDSFDGPWETGE